MCLHDDVVDDCKLQCIQNRFLEFFLEQFLNVQENGELTGTLISDFEVSSQTTSTISRRDSYSGICHPVEHTQAENNC